MIVADAMTPNPRCVIADEPLLAAASLMLDHDIGFVPVVAGRTDRRPVGVLTDRDIAIRYVAAGYHHECACGEAMTAGPLATVDATEPVAAVLEAMRRFGVRRVLVLEPRGRLVGVVAMADLLRRIDAVGRDEVTALAEMLAEPLVLQR